MSTPIAAQPGSPEALGMSPDQHERMVMHLLTMEIKAGDDEAARSRVSEIENGLKDGSMTPQEIPVNLNRRTVREYISDKANGARHISRKGVATVLAVTVGVGAVGGPVAAVAKETGTTPAAATATTPTQTTETTPTSTTPTQTTETTSTSTTPASTVEGGAAAPAEGEKDSETSFEESITNFIDSTKAIEDLNERTNFNPSQTEMTSARDARNDAYILMLDASTAQGVDQKLAKLVDDYKSADDARSEAFRNGDEEAQQKALKALDTAETKLEKAAKKFEPSSEPSETDQTEEEQQSAKEEKTKEDLQAAYSKATAALIEAAKTGDEEKIKAAQAKSDQALEDLISSINNESPKGGPDGDHDFNPDHYKNKFTSDESAGLIGRFEVNEDAPKQTKENFYRELRHNPRALAFWKTCLENGASYDACVTKDGVLDKAAARYDKYRELPLERKAEIADDVIKQFEEFKYGGVIEHNGLYKTVAATEGGGYAPATNTRFKDGWLQFKKPNGDVFYVRACDQIVEDVDEETPANPVGGVGGPVQPISPTGGEGGPAQPDSPSGGEGGPERPNNSTGGEDKKKQKPSNKDPKEGREVIDNHGGRGAGGEQDNSTDPARTDSPDDGYNNDGSDRPAPAPAASGQGGGETAPVGDPTPTTVSEPQPGAATGTAGSGANQGTGTTNTGVATTPDK